MSGQFIAAFVVLAVGVLSFVFHRQLGSFNHDIHAEWSLNMMRPESYIWVARAFGIAVTLIGVGLLLGAFLKVE